MKNKKILFAIIVDNFKLIICQNSIKINCSHILPANKNFAFYNIRHLFYISCQKHFLGEIFLEMVKTVTFRNPLGSLHGNFNNFDTNGVMPAGKFEKFLLSLTISLHILPAVPFLFWVLKQVQ